jgi:CRP/FNR family cyclic AMP-dependent transcriptional regulator
MKTTDPKIGLLRLVPGFADLSERELARFAPLFDEARLDAGMVLAREGRVGHELLLIVDGQATLRQRGEVRDVLGPGAIVGETAILGEVPHWSSVVSQTPMRVLVAGRESFRALGHDPDLLRRVAATLAARLRDEEPAPLGNAAPPGPDETAVGPAPAVR